MDKLNDEIMVDRDKIIQLELYSSSFVNNGKYNEVI